MKTHARKVVYDLLELMPSAHQRASLKTMLALLLEARGMALPEHAEGKSPSAISRFLNRYRWPTRALVRLLRREAVAMLMERSASKRGRRPILRAMVDMTTLHKVGSFEGLGGLVAALGEKRGLHLVVLYLEVDRWRVPWSFRVWRGKGEASAGALALAMLRSLPDAVTARHRVMVLADSAFSGAGFLRGVRRMGHHAVVGVRKDRNLSCGTRLDRAGRQGGPLFLEGLPDVPVYAASYQVKKPAGKRERRFVLTTKAMRPRHIVRWGRRRWMIEAFFKSAKGRFSLHRFGQGSRLGAYRYLALSFAAYLLAHWGHLMRGFEGPPRWGEAAESILEEALSGWVVESLLREIEQRDALFRRHGVEVQVDRCKI